MACASCGATWLAKAVSRCPACGASGGRQGDEFTKKVDEPDLFK